MPFGKGVLVAAAAVATVELVRRHGARVDARSKQVPLELEPPVAVPEPSEVPAARPHGVPGLVPGLTALAIGGGVAAGVGIAIRSGGFGGKIFRAPTFQPGGFVLQPR